MTYEDAINQYAEEMGDVKITRTKLRHPLSYRDIVAGRVSSWKTLLKGPLTLDKSNEIRIPPTLAENAKCKENLDKLYAARMKIAVEEVRTLISTTDEKTKPLIESLEIINQNINMSEPLPEAQLKSFNEWQQKIKSKAFKRSDLEKVQPLFDTFQRVDDLISDHLGGLSLKLGIDLSFDLRLNKVKPNPFQLFRDEIRNYFGKRGQIIYKCQLAQSEKDIRDIKILCLKLQPVLDKLIEIVDAVRQYMENYHEKREDYVQNLFSIYTERKRTRIAQRMRKSSVSKGTDSPATQPQSAVSS